MAPNYPWSPATDESWSVATHWPALVAVLCENVADSTTELGGEIERLCKHGLFVASASQCDARRDPLDALVRHRVAGKSCGWARACTTCRRTAWSCRHSCARPCANASATCSSAAWRSATTCKRAEVWVDGAIAAGLMHAGLEWALSFFAQGAHPRSNRARTDEPACLVIRGALPSPTHSRPAIARRHRRMNDNLHWVLMRQLAAGARLPIGRSSSAATESARDRISRHDHDRPAPPRVIQSRQGPQSPRRCQSSQEPHAKTCEAITHSPVIFLSAWTLQGQPQHSRKRAKGT